MVPCDNAGPLPGNADAAVVLAAVPASVQTLNAAAMLALLADAVATWGGQKSFARRFGVHQRDVSLALSGKRPVSAAVARALGYTRYVEPRRICYASRPAPHPEHAE